MCEIQYLNSPKLTDFFNKYDNKIVESKLKRKCEKFEVELLEIDFELKQFKVLAPHFSGYKFEEEDDDEEKSSSTC